MLPPDLRGQVEGQRGHRGIGGGAHENVQASAARARAMGDAPAPSADDKAPAAEEKKAESKLELCPNVRCKSELRDQDNYCPKCGLYLLPDKDPMKALGIASFSEEDVEDYIFKGFIVRDVTVLGTHRLRVRSSQGTDIKDVDALMINGEYKDKGLSTELYSNLKSLAIASACIAAFDGSAIGDDLAKKVAWLEGKGSAFIDIVTRSVALFNRTWTKHLEEKNNVLGS